LIRGAWLGIQEGLVLGTGFTAPRPYRSRRRRSRIPNDAAHPHVLAQLLRDDAALLATINTALHTLGAPPMDALHTIFSQADDALAMTLHWDHFGSEPGVRYLGVEAPACVRCPGLARRWWSAGVWVPG